MSSYGRHHFVPQFYLRNFSDQNGKRISVYDIEHRRYVPLASVRHQAQRQRLYKKESTEQMLSTLEAAAAPIIRDAINNRTVPGRGTDKHVRLVLFLLFLRTRTPAEISGARFGMSEMTRMAIADHPDAQDLIDLPDLAPPDLLEMQFRTTCEMLPHAVDLECGLVCNNADATFISSDNPCVACNPFLETRKAHASVTGIAEKGLLIVLPLSPRTCLLLFDSSTYRLGGLRKQVVLHRNRDVCELNLLQAVNCDRLLFSTPRAGVREFRPVLERARQYRPGQRSKVQWVPGVDGTSGRKMDLLHLKNWEPRTGLQVPGLRVLKRAARHQCNNSVVEPRNAAVYQHDLEFQRRLDSGVSIEEIIRTVRHDVLQRGG